MTVRADTFVMCLGCYGAILLKPVGIALPLEFFLAYEYAITVGSNVEDAGDSKHVI